MGNILNCQSEFMKNLQDHLHIFYKGSIPPDLTDMLSDIQQQKCSNCCKPVKNTICNTQLTTQQLPFKDRKVISRPNNNKCIIYIPDKYFYYGAASNNLENGNGMMYQQNRLYYVGDFKDGLPDGKGTLNHYNGLNKGQTIKDGTFEQGKLVKGTIRPDPSNSQVFQIKVENKKYQIVFRDEKKYEGQGYFNKDNAFVIHGKGRYTDRLNKYEYDGYWENGVKDGFAKEQRDNCVYEGSFIKGKKNKGVLEKGQYRYEGVWNNGVSFDGSVTHIRANITKQYKNNKIVS